MADKYPELGFKFAIGDDVMFAVAVRDATARNEGQNTKWLDARPQRLTVVERFVNECYGGIQRCYDLRATATSDRLSATIGVQGALTPNGLLRASEIELVAAVEAPSASEVESVTR